MSRANTPAHSPDGWTGFFVPGRIEVLGKHTDYAGGASITCATIRGFTLHARRCTTGGVHVRSRDGTLTHSFLVDPDVHAEGWANYVATVIRRVVRNAPGTIGPTELVFESNLPPASGMSSSSAFMIAVFLGLDAASGGRVSDALRATLPTIETLAEYLACIENGASYGRLEGERGVGTVGGSQDHTAILCSESGRLRRYRYAPYAQEGRWPFPEGHEFVVAASGVLAEKTGAARDDYNRASDLARAATRCWSTLTGREARHLADVIGADPGATTTLVDGLSANGSHAVTDAMAGFTATDLARRVEAFAAEMRVVDRAGSALAGGDLNGFAAAVRDSQEASETLLGNQVPETIHLARSAERHGAIAASAFGAGFGGSVWAIVPGAAVPSFVEQWKAGYAEAFPEPAVRALFVREKPSAGAVRLDGAPVW